MATPHDFAREFFSKRGSSTLQDLSCKYPHFSNCIDVPFESLLQWAYHQRVVDQDLAAQVEPLIEALVDGGMPEKLIGTAVDYFVVCCALGEEVERVVALSYEALTDEHKNSDDHSDVTYQLLNKEVAVRSAQWN